MFSHEAYAQRVCEPAYLISFTIHVRPYHVGVPYNGRALRVPISQHRPLINISRPNDRTPVIGNHDLGVNIELLRHQHLFGAYIAPLSQGVELDVVLRLNRLSPEPSKDRRLTPAHASVLVLHN